MEPGLSAVYKERLSMNNSTFHICPAGVFIEPSYFNKNIREPGLK